MSSLDAELITTQSYCICQAYWFDIITSQAHISLLEGKLIIIPIETPNFTTTNVKYRYQEYRAYVRLVSQSHPVFTPIVICTYTSSLTISPSFYTYCYLYIQSYDSTPIREQFCGILYNHATCVVLLTFISYFAIYIYIYIYIYTTVFMPYVLFCKHFWDPKHVHCHLIYQR